MPRPLPSLRVMSAGPPHLQRTAASPRAPTRTRATLSAVRQATPTTRLVTLSLPGPLRFQAGQWLDVWLPGVRDAGGFTVVSAPHLAAAATHGPEARRLRAPARDGPAVQLAVRRSANEAARWLWREPPDLLGQEVDVRVGGGFVWPPEAQGVRRAVFVAGGVGVNPFVSMLAEMERSGGPAELVMLYGCKEEHGGEDGESVLFGERLREVFGKAAEGWELRLYLTGGAEGDKRGDKDAVQVTRRRMTADEAIAALGPPERRAETVVYVCGPQEMTDSFVAALKAAEGMSDDRVLCEKWW